jgi:hypothetical protein
MSEGNFCTQCGSRIQNTWKFCKGCGKSIDEPLTVNPPQTLMEAYSDHSDEAQPPVETNRKAVDAAVVAWVGILAVALLFVGIYLANRVDPENFATRLNEVSEFYWDEDPLASVATEDRYSALRGFFADKCNVYIYETEAQAVETARDYLNLKTYWTGTDDKTSYGVVIADRGNNSSCTDQAAEAFGWTLEH